MIIGIAGLPELTHNYIEAIHLAAKGTAPVSTEVSLLPKAASRWDALVLPGGGDIDPMLLPGSPAPDPHCHDIDPALDRRQLALLELFARNKKPVLGICKGMQLIALYFGCGFCQHLPTAWAHRYKEYDQLHITHAESGSFLENLYGKSFAVNSAHHQGILPPDDSVFPLSIIQTAGDGVPEGLVHQTLPIIGLQWHPERLCGRFARADAADGSLVFQHFLSLCDKPGARPIPKGRPQ